MRLFRPTRQHSPEEPETSFWQSYSDLMAGMLLVFVLLLVLALFHYAQSIKKREDLVAAKGERLEEQERKLLSFHETRRLLIETLQGSLSDKDVVLDPATGALNIESAILFGEGEAILRDAGRERLISLFETYFKVILDDRFHQVVKLVEIEGHTNSNGGYLYNLQLSQARALAVMEALLDQAGSDREKLQSLVTASGRAFSHLILDAQGNEDPVRSRRIEIKFRLKEAELFRDIYEDLRR